MGQTPLLKLLTPDFLATHLATHQTVNFFNNKKIDSTFLTQIKTALLFYPELKDAKITFRHKKNLSPLTARPSVWAIFKT
ncbi:MAG: hypothetical protein HC817_16750 [Saprospiraceae bacterium]|nr:hypothetical protein [Saprospiraceae bacterium]